MPEGSKKMRHAEWKKLLRDPVVLKAKEALRMAKEELASDPACKQKMTPFVIFPDASRKKRPLLLAVDFAYALPGQAPLTRHEIAWETIANANLEEAKEIVLAAMRKFPPVLDS
jgi:hypothetical protein